MGLSKELHQMLRHCNTFQPTATQCNPMQPIATHYNTLQHTATHCNTLQRIAVTHVIRAARNAAAWIGTVHAAKERTDGVLPLRTASALL